MQEQRLPNLEIKNQPIRGKIENGIFKENGEGDLVLFNYQDWLAVDAFFHKLTATDSWRYSDGVETKESVIKRIQKNCWLEEIDDFVFLAHHRQRNCVVELYGGSVAGILGILEKAKKSILAFWSKADVVKKTEEESK